MPSSVAASTNIVWNPVRDSTALPERGRTGRFGQREAAVGPRQRGRDAVSREVWLDRQVGTAGLEDREDGGHPVEIAFCHDRDDTLGSESSHQKGSRQTVGAAVQLAVRQLPFALDGRDGVRVGAYPIFEQLVEAPIRKFPVRPGETIELCMALLGRQQCLLPVRGVRIGGDQRERGEVITGDPGGTVHVEHVGPVSQSQHEIAVVCRDSDRQHGVLGELRAGARRVEHGLERRFGQAHLAPEVIDRKVLMYQQL